MPFNLIETFKADYSETELASTKRVLKRILQLDETDERMKHFYFNGGKIYSLPNKQNSNVSFSSIPIALFLDKDCKIVEFEFYPIYSQNLVEKGKKITNTVY